MPRHYTLKPHLQAQENTPGHVSKLISPNPGEYSGVKSCWKWEEAVLFWTASPLSHYSIKVI